MQIRYNNRIKMKAYVFPGQGAQFVGMGKDLYDNNPEAKELLKKPMIFSDSVSRTLCLKVRRRT